MAKFKSGTMERTCDDWVAQVKECGESRRRYQDYYGDYIHSGRSAVFFDGAVIYSHGIHYPMGELVRAQGRTVALINHTPWESETARGRRIVDSPSTRNHRSHAEGACDRAKVPFLRVYGLPFDPVEGIAQRHAKAVERLKEACARRKPRFAAHDVFRAAHQLDAARKVSEVFGIPVPRFTPTPPVEAMLESMRGFAVRTMIATGDTSLRDALAEFSL